MDLYPITIEVAAREYSFFSYMIYDACLKHLETLQCIDPVTFRNFTSTILTAMRRNAVFITGKEADEVIFSRTSIAWNKITVSNQVVDSRQFYACPELKSIIAVEGAANPKGNVHAVHKLYRECY
jgi:hypothetical protein